VERRVHKQIHRRGMQEDRQSEDILTVLATTHKCSAEQPEGINTCLPRLARNTRLATTQVTAIKRAQSITASTRANTQIIIRRG
jgi:hypothetical protein